MNAVDTDLPRYIESFRSRYIPLTMQERGVGRLGAELLYTAQQPGDWSDEATSDLAISLAFDSAPFELTIDGERVNSSDGPKGNFAVVSPGASTRFIQKAYMRALLVAIPTAVLVHYAEREDATWSLDFSSLHAQPSGDPEVVRLMEGMWSAARSGFAGGHLQSDGYVLHLIAALLRLRDGKARPLRGGLSAWQMRRCAQLLDDPEAGHLSLQDLASEVGLSPFHFSRAFKQSFGVPPFRYQILRRLEHARQLLRETRRPVTDIALAVGYESSQALAKVFRREVGTTPTEYRADWT